MTFLGVPRYLESSSFLLSLFFLAVIDHSHATILSIAYKSPIDFFHILCPYLILILVFVLECHTEGYSRVKERLISRFCRRSPCVTQKEVKKGSRVPSVTWQYTKTMFGWSPANGSILKLDYVLEHLSLLGGLILGCLLY